MPVAPSRPLLPGLLLLCAGLPAFAGTGIDLDGPEVYKLDWNTRALRQHDVDSDGRIDLLLLNNDTTKLEILYQRKPGKPPRARSRPSRTWEPVLEDSRFDRQSIVTGVKMYDLAVGDLDGDGRPDLAFTSDADGLTVLYQGAGDDWSRRRDFRDVEPATWRSSHSAGRE